MMLERHSRSKYSGGSLFIRSLKLILWLKKMASSSSVGSREGNRAGRRGLRSKCFCEDRVGKWTSWSNKNPGRRFIGCPNFRDPEMDCKYFTWVDPPLPNHWYKDMLFDFYHHGTGFKQDGFEDFMEEHVEEHVAEAVAEPVAQGVPKARQDGLVGVNFMIVFWVSLFALVWYMMM